MNRSDLEVFVAGWIERRVGNDALLHGVVPGLHIESVEATPNLWRATDSERWQVIAPIRMERELTGWAYAGDLNRLLDNHEGEFFRSVGAALLDGAGAPPAPPPPTPLNLAGALRRYGTGVRAALVPPHCTRLGPLAGSSVPVLRSGADPDHVVLLLNADEAERRVRYDHAVKQEGSAMFLILAATIARPSVPAPCVIRVPLP